MIKAIIYTSNTCSYCKVAKGYLQNKGVEIEERNIKENPIYREELISKGYRGVPVIIIGNSEISGFNERLIDETLLMLEEEKNTQC